MSRPGRPVADYLVEFEAQELLEELKAQGLDEGALGLVESRLSDSGYGCVRLRFDKHGVLTGAALRRPPTERAYEIRAKRLNRSAG